MPVPIFVTLGAIKQMLYWRSQCYTSPPIGCLSCERREDCMTLFQSMTKTVESLESENKETPEVPAPSEFPIKELKILLQYTFQMLEDRFEKLAQTKL